MLVGLGGNNGTTLVGGVIANREGITWKTKEGIWSAYTFFSFSSRTVRASHGKLKKVYALQITMAP